MSEHNESSSASVWLSYVIPVLNEEENIRILVDRIVKSLAQETRPYEIIFIDDGSTDNTIQEILDVRKNYPHQIKLIKLSRNFGQHKAVQAGFDHCLGDIIVWIDADLQEPPEEVPRLIEKLGEGYDIVYGIRRETNVSYFKILSSLSFVRLFNWATRHSLPENACTLRVMTRRFVDSVNSMPERVRFMAGINGWVGFRRAGVEIAYKQRSRGASKYTAIKLLRLSLDGLLSFSTAPIRLISTFGFVVAGLSFAYLLVVVAGYFLGIMGSSSLGWTSLIASIYFIGGVQCLFLGLLGEYLGRVYLEVKQRPLYIIEESIGFQALETGMSHSHAGFRSTANNDVPKGRPFSQ